MRPIFSIFFVLITCLGFAQKKGLRFTVEQSGKADFNKVQDALNAIPAGNTVPVEIYIRTGIYREVVTVDASKKNVYLKGEDAKNTTIIFNNHAGTRLPNGDTLNTWTCASVFVYGDGFTATDITFANDAGFTAGQAVAIRIEANRAAFRNCRFIGHQDVLFLSGSGVKHYFEQCYIEGTTDFIFGAATAFFSRCHMHSKKNSHVTAASTNSIIPFGFVFESCRLTADSNINKVSLGRPWSPTASVTYLNCWMDKHIIPEGWNNWRNPANESTARYAEFNSTGPGGNKQGRCLWSKQLTEHEAAAFSKEKVLYPWKPFAE
jgi:pectinesterase